MARSSLAHSHALCCLKARPNGTAATHHLPPLLLLLLTPLSASGLMDTAPLVDPTLCVPSDSPLQRKAEDRGGRLLRPVKSPPPRPGSRLARNIICTGEHNSNYSTRNPSWSQPTHLSAAE